MVVTTAFRLDAHQIANSILVQQESPVSQENSRHTTAGVEILVVSPGDLRVVLGDDLTLSTIGYLVSPPHTNNITLHGNNCLTDCVSCLIYLPVRDWLLKISLTCGYLSFSILISTYPAPRAVTRPWVVITFIKKQIVVVRSLILSVEGEGGMVPMTETTFLLTYLVLSTWEL